MVAGTAVIGYDQPSTIRTQPRRRPISPQRPKSAGEQFTIDDVQYRALAVIPARRGDAFRVPALRISSSDDGGDNAPHPVEDVTTFVFPANEPPIPLPGMQDWTGATGPQAPLACELRPGDALDPPRAALGRRSNSHRDDAPVLRNQVVISVSYDPYDGLVSIQTRDNNNQLRRWKRYPEERVDFTRPYTRRYNVRPPDAPSTAGQGRRASTGVFEGPFLSVTGAQFVFQKRSTRGGRTPRNAPRFDPDLKPLFDEVTGDLLPYVVMEPIRGEEIAGTFQTPDMFSPTARKLPHVQFILRAAGFTVDDPEETEAATDE